MIFVNPTEPLTEVQTPAQRAEIMAAFACLTSLVSLFAISQPLVEFLKVWWVGGLLCLLLPIALTFTILYGSCVHREMGKLARGLFLFGNSLLIFGCICLGLLAVAFVAVALMPLSRFHY